MTRLLNWLARLQAKQHGINEIKRKSAEAIAKAEGRLHEQEKLTEQAVRDNPISHRIRARPAFNAGGRDVPKN